MKKFLFLIPFFAVLLFPSDTFATRVDVDVNHLDDYFDTVIYNGNNFSFDITSSTINTHSEGSLRGMAFYLKESYPWSCPEGNRMWSYVVYGSGFESSMFNSLGNRLNYHYESGSFNNGIYYTYSQNRYFTIFASSSYSTFPISNYSFNTLTLGCSEEEVAPASPTPTPTPTPTATPTPTPTEEPSPTPTPEEIDPSEYEYNAVEDSIIKYRFISWIIISVAGYLIYKLIIKRIIIR